MKVLWFTLTPCGAGKKLTPENFIAGWLASLEQQIKLDKGIDLHVCFYYNGEIESFVHESVTYHPIKRGRGKLKVNKFIDRLSLFNSQRDKPYIAKLTDVVEKVKPDVIHVHGCEENFGLVQDFTNIPLVISIQSLLNPYVEKFFSGIPLSIASKHEKLKSKLLFDSAKNQFYLFSMWANREKKILKPAKFIIGRTNWDKRITRILAPNSRYYIGNEIMRDAFYEKKWSKTIFDEKISLVSTISGGLYKGLESVLKVASILSEYKFNFEWLIIGQLEHDDYPCMIKNWLDKDFIKTNVKLLGKKSEIEVADILCQSDIYCQVSHIENSPNSVCEAMLLGLPIVATFAGGTDSIIQNSVEGILVQDGDSLSMAGAVIEMAKNFDKSKSYGDHARKTALIRHNREKVAHEIIDVYKNILIVNESNHGEIEDIDHYAVL